MEVGVGEDIRCRGLHKAQSKGRGGNPTEGMAQVTELGVGRGGEGTGCGRKGR